MNHFIIPADDLDRPLPYYLELEERIASSCAPGEEWLMVWSVGPTVICGRNQDIPAEVDLDYCRDQGINVCRRKSGGGAVYADSGNLMVSYITRTPDDVPTVFARYTHRLARALRDIGIDAHPTGHNDIEVDGRKVSGGAFHRTPDGASIAHSTMLYNIDMINMSRALTPSRAKLESHGVTSVEARVALIKDMTLLSFEAFSQALVERLLASD